SLIDALPKYKLIHLKYIGFINTQTSVSSISAVTLTDKVMVVTQSDEPEADNGEHGYPVSLRLT
ncbi:hypothetical protein, partial [Xanthomonas campestris]|uniref:hypothetical protein n=1 Tax=Xanthomonas campestris TaxID=339 RepID=UPI001F227ED2